MRTPAILTVCAALALNLLGCSNDSGTSGPETLPVELSVSVQGIFSPVRGATVQVSNYTGTTDTTGWVVFHSDINSLVPNHTYRITVTSSGWVEAFPDEDTIRVPSSPNEPSGYVLQTTVFMKPQ